MAQSFPTVLLRHEDPVGIHYDWMLADPCTWPDPNATLWTVRTTLSSDQWRRAGQWPIEPIAPHRRLYLEYEGPLSAGRGAVARVDHGSFVPRCWTMDEKVFDLEFIACSGRIRVYHQGLQWFAAFMT